VRRLKDKSLDELPRTPCTIPAVWRKNDPVRAITNPGFGVWEVLDGEPDMLLPTVVGFIME